MARRRRALTRQAAPPFAAKRLPGPRPLQAGASLHARGWPRRRQPAAGRT
ncbi:hypothetical protein C7S14_6729 [Burkholderia cepacia]|nr:hypothetical protein C7S14_6729 [Burkholderia cepacia]